MRIATWNVERLEHKNRLDEIIADCRKANADILVLTEADERVCLPEYEYYFCTRPPQDYELPPYTVPVHYAPTERRVMVYSKFPCVARHSTYDDSTAICVELQTDRGNLCVYGTIIGINGHKKPFFEDALNGQMADLKKLTAGWHQICFLGDYNCSFADGYYFTHNARNSILKCFSEIGVDILTKNRLECVDHISISQDFVHGAAVQVDEWNLDKKLSDHKGIWVSFG